MADPNAMNQDYTRIPCASCDDVSTANERMICCDGCKQWFHLRCVWVSVEEAEKKKKWYCGDDKCQPAKRKRDNPTKRNGGESDRFSVKSDAVLTLEDKIKAIEENHKRMEQEMEVEIILKKKEKDIKRSIDRKRMVLEKQIREEEEEEENLLQEEILQERWLQLKRMKARKRMFDKKMKSLDSEMAKLKTVKRNQMPLGVGESVSRKNDRVETSRVDSDSDDKSDSDDGSEEANSESSDGFKVSAPTKRRMATRGNGKSKAHNTSKHGLGWSRWSPTKYQLAARNGISKKLPTFSGDPEEWPLFYGAYKASNDACGYSNVENLVRLQECLKGPALEMVRGQLLLPKSVPKVIEKLRQLYGRPEQLLQSHLRKVRRLEPPKAEQLASFIPFGTAVEQLCEHLEAADLKQHLVNPLLIQDLLEKLPDSNKREWIRFKRGKKKVTLRTFTDFLSEIVSDACEANVNVQFEPKNMPNDEELNEAKANESKGSLFNHSTGVNTPTNSPAGAEQRRSAKPCKMCKRTDHRLRYCQEFRSLACADRIKVVEQWKLCRTCLNDHGTVRCKFKLRCNVGECQQAHHSLLHPTDGMFDNDQHIQPPSKSIFRIVPVRLYNGGKSVTVLAFLDEGASVTLIEQKLANRLGVVGIHEELTIQWTADIERVEKDSTRSNMWVSAIESEEKIQLDSVQTVEKLVLPAQTLDVDALCREYSHLHGLPISSYNGRPEVLIGLNNLHSFAPLEAKIGEKLEPIAVRCPLGWTVYGPKKISTTEPSGYVNIHQIGSVHSLLKEYHDQSMNRKSSDQLCGVGEIRGKSWSAGEILGCYGLGYVNTTMLPSVSYKHKRYTR